MGRSNATVYTGRDIAAVLRLHHDVLTDDLRRLPIVEQLDRQARRILEAHRSGDEAVAVHVTCWHPELVGSAVEDILKHRLTLNDARETIAREYGFDDWADVERRGTDPPDPDFESAVDALLAGDAGTLRDLLARRPALVREQSSFGHRATLLHYAGSNGVETYRQVVPLNLADLAQMLIDAGADVNATAGMYGGDCATLGLVLTSSHLAEAGVVDDVVKVLVDAGAETDDS